MVLWGDKPSETLTVQALKLINLEKDSSHDLRLIDNKYGRSRPNASFDILKTRKKVAIGDSIFFVFVRLKPFDS